MLISLFFSTLLLFMLIAILAGAPLVPSKKATAQKMIELLNVQKGQTVFDLGSGDGRLLLKIAERGAYAHGIEINPYAVLWSKLRTLAAGQSKHIRVRWGNYWWSNLKEADAIVVYALPHLMPGLVKKIKKEVKKGTPIVSNSFQMPGLTLISQERVGKDKIYLYQV